MDAFWREGVVPTDYISYEGVSEHLAPYIPTLSHAFHARGKGVDVVIRASNFILRGEACHLLAFWVFLH